ncbi:MAG: hypothetical protein PW788_12315 [Micavibrio sp.]|nr:hypothetical protein [Micavibrio sp.]
MQKADTQNLGNNAANTAKEFVKDAKTYANNAVHDAEANYTEIGDIRRDIESLKENIAALTQHLKSDGKAKVADLKDAASQRVDDMVAKSDETLAKLESQVKDNPRQAIMVAFAAGLVTSFLLRSRG